MARLTDIAMLMFDEVWVEGLLGLLEDSVWRLYWGLLLRPLALLFCRPAEMKRLVLKSQVRFRSLHLRVMPECLLNIVHSL